MKHYDMDGDGNITYEEFLRGLRDDLTPRRAAMVEKAYCMLDRDNCGGITIKDIIGIYDVSMNPEFLEGRKTRE